MPDITLDEARRQLHVLRKGAAVISWVHSLRVRERHALRAALASRDKVGMSDAHLAQALKAFEGSDGPAPTPEELANRATELTELADERARLEEAKTGNKIDEATYTRVKERLDERERDLNADKPTAAEEVPPELPPSEIERLAGDRDRLEALHDARKISARDYARAKSLLDARGRKLDRD
jgi:hypothetical protein